MPIPGNLLTTAMAVMPHTDIDKLSMLERSLLSPATCCLVNPDKEKTVEKAFQVVKNISARLRSRYHLSDRT